MRNDITAGVILIEHLDILDLSHGGIRFTCTKALSPNQSVQLVLRKDATRVHLRGKVVRSRFVGAVRILDQDHISYEVAVAFEHAPTEERQLLEFVRLLEGRPE